MAPRPEGERRRVTVLFADLVGFSTLAENLDPEELRAFMGDTFTELTEAVEARDGQVEKYIGDAVVAVFGAPVTHEDDPARAAETAFAMLEVVGRRSREARAPLDLRIGVNSGLVVAGTVGDGRQTGVIGDAVNVAARLQQAAGSGEVLVAGSTWRRVRDLFEADRVGELDLKGRSQRVEAYRLRARREPRRRATGPFVGRLEELALLELLWSSVRKGNTHVVSVVGEPGVGKTRLLTEFHPEGDPREVRVTCGGETALGPIIDLVSQLLGAAPEDVAELERRAAALEIDAAAVAGLAPLFGLGTAPSTVRLADEQQKRETFAGVWQFLLAVCSDLPALVIVDDVHWSDASSRELLGFLLQRLGGARLMLVLSYRPGFEAVQRAELRASHTAVRLEPLTADESLAVARGFLGVSDLPPDLEQLVASRAGGNPFFIEELLQALLEVGALDVVDGRAELAMVELDVPDTVQGTILARIDRLEAGEREVLHHAAVLGRSFTGELVEAIVGRGELRVELAALARTQLLVEVGPGQWAFKHDLIREVAYETLLLKSRRDLHGKVAEVLESRVGDDPGHLEALAEHYARAEIPEQARTYAVAAGDVAQARSGFADAKRRYESALALWGEGDEEGRLELLMKLAHSAMWGGDSTTARTAFIGAEEGWRRLGDRRRAGAALAGLGRAGWAVGETERSADALNRAISLLEGLGPSRELVQAYAWLSTLRMLEGMSDEASELAETALPLAEQLELDALRSDLLNTLGVCEVFAGREEGLERLELAFAIARESGDVEALGRGYTNIAECLFKVGRLPEALRVAREGVDAMGRAGHTARAAFIASNEAWILLDLGRFEEAEAVIAGMLDTGQAMMGTVGLMNAAMPRAVAAMRRGDYGPARAMLDEILPPAREFGGVEFFAPALRYEAELEEARGNLPAARESMRRAIDVVLSATPSVHSLELLPLAVRLLPAEVVTQVLERTRALPGFERDHATRAETEGLLSNDRSRLREAAGLYRELEMPYDEARCRIELGELERARELVEWMNAAAGPLGSRLAAVAR